MPELPVFPEVKSGRVTTHSSGSLNVTSEIVNKPDLVASGDLLILYTVMYGGTLADLTVPTGFTQLGELLYSSGQTSHSVAYKVAGGSEPSSYTYGRYSASGNGASLLISIDAASWDGNTANLRYAESTATKTASNIPSVTPATDRSMVITSGHWGASSSGTTSWIAPGDGLMEGLAVGASNRGGIGIASHLITGTSAVSGLSWGTSVFNSGVAAGIITTALSIGAPLSSYHTAISGPSSGGSGGALTDATYVSFNNGVRTHTYHRYAAGLDWTKPVGLLIYTDGSGEYGLTTPSSSYLLNGTHGMIAIAKKHNMILLTPMAPGGNCNDGDGVCWYDSSSSTSTTPAIKLKWSKDLIDFIFSQYNIDRSRVAFGGYSSGAQWTTQYWGPGHAHEVMTDGVAVAISYGGDPKVTNNNTTAYKNNVPVVWNVGHLDEAWSQPTWDDSVSKGRTYYDSNGYSTDITILGGVTHDRYISSPETGEFGRIMDRAITRYVRPAVVTEVSIASSTSVVSGTSSKISITGEVPGTINIVGSAYEGSASVTFITHQAGDLIVVTGFDWWAGPTPSPPAGWTLASSVTTGNLQTAVAYKFAEGPGTLSGTWTNTEALEYVIYRGVDYVGAASLASGYDTSTYTPPPITLTQPGIGWVTYYDNDIPKLAGPVSSWISYAENPSFNYSIELVPKYVSPPAGVSSTTAATSSVVSVIGKQSMLVATIAATSGVTVSLWSNMLVTPSTTAATTSAVASINAERGIKSTTAVVSSVTTILWSNILLVPSVTESVSNLSTAIVTGEKIASATQVVSVVSSQALVLNIAIKSTTPAVSLTTGKLRSNRSIKSTTPVVSVVTGSSLGFARQLTDRIEYTMIATTRTGEFIAEIPFDNLQGEFFYNKQDEIRFTIHEEVLNSLDKDKFYPAKTEIVLLRNGKPIFCGPLWTINYSESNNKAGCVANDLSSYFDNRIVVSDTYEGSYGDMAWEIIADTQALTMGDLGVTRGLVVGPGAPSGVLGVKAGTYVTEVLTDLSELEDGFDWNIGPDRVYNQYYPRLQVPSSVVFEFGGVVKSYAITYDGKYTGNSVVTRGKNDAMSTTAINSTSRSMYGLQEYVGNNTALTTMDQLDSYNAELLNLRQWPRKHVTIVLAQGSVSPFDDDFEFGHVIRTVINDGYNQIDQPMRCQGYQLSIGPQGDETLVVYMNDMRGFD